MSIKEILNLVVRIGIGSTLLLGGMLLIIFGAIKDWQWPFYIVGGSVIMLVGLLAIGLDIFKTLRQQKIDLANKNWEAEKCKNFDTYKILTEKRARQDKRLEELKTKEIENDNNN